MWLYRSTALVAICRDFTTVSEGLGEYIEQSYDFVRCNAAFTMKIEIRLRRHQQLWMCERNWGRN
ncbi:hypothetical protein M3J09_004534 [Ascochyta lentis]